MNTREIRRLVRTRAALIEFDRGGAISGMAAVRDGYIVEKGLPAYLSEMLAEISTVEAYKCRLHWADGRLRSPDTNEEIQKYLVRLADGLPLPYKVVVDVDGDVRVKYL